MMKAVLAVVVLAAALQAALGNLDFDVTDDRFVLPAFTEFVAKHNRAYASASETVMRYLVFKENLAKAKELNKKNGDPAFGITKFSDMTATEFKQKLLGFKPATDTAQFSVLPRVPATTATSADWRTKGAISKVKDQGQCGSCWAFSVTEQVESNWFQAGHALPELSPQQIVSCDKVDQGCNGGDTPTGYQYVIKAGGLESAAAYPYTSGDTGSDGSCKFSSGSVVAKISNFTYVIPPCTDSCSKQDETGLQNFVATKGPASICVYAEVWQNYVSGILKSNCPHDYSSLDHCVQVVGFNAESSPGYWIVRNSWNEDWGVGGYIYVEMGQNLCGIADEVTVAVV